jgi:hypothetical protein
MKLPCPFCTENIVYDHKLAGKTIKCSYCQKNILMTPFNKLPPDYQQEYKAELEKIRKKQEAEQRKMEAKRLKELERQEVEKQHNIEQVFETAKLEQKKMYQQMLEKDWDLNFTEMFLGKEKEHIFHLLPGEEHVDELTIHHQHVFFMQAGITRVTLTTHRILYTATRVFSPVYWLLLVLFPPLIFYYAARVARNRNLSMPLGGIDSVEKRYWPNGLMFLVAIILAYMVASLSGKAVATVFGGAQQHALLGEFQLLEWTVTGIVTGLLSPAVLILLLATRMVGIDVRSKNNKFPIRYSPGDRGVSEGKIDSFLQNVHAAMVHARQLQLQRQPMVTPDHESCA